jgi:hypothetical protein
MDLGGERPLGGSPEKQLSGRPSLAALMSSAAEGNSSPRDSIELRQGLNVLALNVYLLRRLSETAPRLSAGPGLIARQERAIERMRAILNPRRHRASTRAKPERSYR